MVCRLVEQQNIRLLNQQAALERRIGFNEVEKARLEEALAKNAEEKASLLERQELNRKLQDLATQKLKDQNLAVDQLRIELSDFQQTF